MSNNHFLNTYIPKNKNLEIGLSYIYGIGRKESLKICKKLGLNPKMLFKDLNDQVLNNLKSYIEFNYIYGFHLKRLKKQNIDALIKIRSYRGNRHFFGYLVRGQRSKNKRIRKHI
jgi:small subunit ribosomal protein S13